MKIFYEEHPSFNYENYEFPYCIFGIKEKTDTYHDFYEKGFLPYTDNLKTQDEIFYLARSVRVNLTGRIWNYKQRNVINKLSKVYSEDSIKIECLRKEDLRADTDFRNWCLSNARNNFLSPERLDHILSRPYLKDILKISYSSQTLAYLFVIHENRDFLHVWYSFYDFSIDLNDFGKWIFLKAMEWSKQQGYQYFYIGTCYSMHAFYKLTLSVVTSYFNGSEWDSDTSSLKKKLLQGSKSS